MLLDLSKQQYSRFLHSLLDRTNDDTMSDKENEDFDVTTSDKENEDDEVTSFETGYCSEVKEEEEEDSRESPPLEKRPRRGIQFDDNELSKTRTILAALWQSKTTVTGKWMTQASV